MTWRARLTEHQLQRSIAQLLDHYERQGKLKWHSVPNGGHMSPAMGRRRKDEGMKAGAPDLVLYFPGGSAVQVEVKTATGRLSSSQKVWQESCQALTLPYVICRDLGEIEALVESRGLAPWE